VSRIDCLVVGDIMVDHYVPVLKHRPSPETPGLHEKERPPVLFIGPLGEPPLESNAHLGGAGNAALQASRLGASTSLVGVVGNDDPGRFAVNEWAREADDPSTSKLLAVAGRPTTVKRRYVHSHYRHHQYARVDIETQEPVTRDVDCALARAVNEWVSGRNPGRAMAVLVADYGKGGVGTETAATLRNIACQDVTVVADIKGPDFASPKYSSVTAVTLNGAEASRALPVRVPSPDWAGEHGRLLFMSTALKHLLITMGRAGMAVWSNGAEGAECRVIKPDLVQGADITGVSDTVTAVFGLCLAAGNSAADAAAVATIAANLSVAVAGHGTVDAARLTNQLSRTGRRPGVSAGPAAIPFRIGLRELLIRSFDVQELRRFCFYSFPTEQIEESVAWGGSLHTTVDEFVGALARRNMLNEDLLDRILEIRPGRSTDIDVLRTALLAPPSRGDVR